MSEVKDETRQDQPEPGNLTGKAVSRREFLKIAGIAGATVGMGAGLGGLVAACGGTTTTTAAGSSPTVVWGGTGVNLFLVVVGLVVGAAAFRLVATLVKMPELAEITNMLREVFKRTQRLKRSHRTRLLRPLEGGSGS